MIDERDPRRLAERLHAFREAKEPIIREMTKIYALALPTYAIGSDGTMELLHDGLTPELRAILVKYEEMIRILCREALELK